MIAYLSGQRIPFLAMRIARPANDGEAIDHTARDNAERFHRAFPVGEG